MQASKTSQASLPLPASTPSVPSKPLQRQLQTERNGGELFAAELDRASQPETGEGHRTERQVSDARHSRQNERADNADTARTDAREGRSSRSEQRSERREVSDARQRSAYNDAHSKRPEPQATRPDARPTAERPETRASAPETKAERPESRTGEIDVRPAATNFAVPVAQPVAPTQAPQAQVTQVAAPQQAGQGSGQQNTNGQPQTSAPTQPTERVAQRGPRGAEAVFKDVLGEMLMTKEAELNREASILRQVKAQLAPGGREISMQLSPAALGKIDMRIALRSGRLTAVIRASKEEALEALQNQLPELTAGLEAQGFEVVEFDLGLHNA